MNPAVHALPYHSVVLRRFLFFNSWMSQVKWSLKQRRRSGVVISLHNGNPHSEHFQVVFTFFLPHFTAHQRHVICLYFFLATPSLISSPMQSAWTREMTGTVTVSHKIVVTFFTWVTSLWNSRRYPLIPQLCALCDHFESQCIDEVGQGNWVIFLDELFPAQPRIDNWVLRLQDRTIQI